jgi:hypothetical protein
MVKEVGIDTKDVIPRLNAVHAVSTRSEAVIDVITHLAAPFLS